MIVDQDAHPPHHLPTRSRHGCRTACHDRQALVPPWAPLAHALAHSRGDGHQAQPEGLETIPSRSAQGWTLPREARSRLERSVEASIDHVSRAAVCHMPGSDLAATARDQTSGGGAKYGKVGQRCVFSFAITKNNWSQPSFCTLGGSGPNLLCLTSHPCILSLYSNNYPCTTFIVVVPVGPPAACTQQHAPHHSPIRHWHCICETAGLSEVAPAKGP